MAFNVPTQQYKETIKPDQFLAFTMRRVPDENLPPPLITRSAARLAAAHFDAAQDQRYQERCQPGPVPDEQPPPYTPRGMPNALQNQVVAPHAVQEVQVLFERPASRDDTSAQSRFFRISSLASFDEGFRIICQQMRLDHRLATIGYKYDKDPVRQQPYPLANSNDWTACIDKGVRAMRTARSRIVTCKVFDQSLGHHIGSASVRGTNTNQSNRQIVEVQMYRKLSDSLYCQKCQTYCFVLKNGEHKAVNNYYRTLWAKEMVHGRADTTRPPENIVFQEFIYQPPTKRPRNSYGPVPEIHVHVNSTPTTSNEQAPFTTNRNANVASGSVTSPILVQDSPTYDLSPTHEVFEDAVHVDYPSIVSILNTIDSTGRYIDLNFPLSLFADTLAEWNIVTITQVSIMHPSFYVQQIGMSPELADEFVRLCSFTARRAEKGKEKAAY